MVLDGRPRSVFSMPRRWQRCQERKTDAGRPAAGNCPLSKNCRRSASIAGARSARIGPVTFREAIAHFGSARAAAAALATVGDAAIAREEEALAALGGRFLVLGDLDYPPALANLDGAGPPEIITGAQVSRYTGGATPKIDVLWNQTAAGGTYADIPVDQAHTEGNLVSAPAWPAHPAWIAQFLALLGTRITL